MKRNILDQVWCKAWRDTIETLFRVLLPKFIEKHFTLNKGLPGPDHILSADENDLKSICDFAKNFGSMTGTGKINPGSDELQVKKIANKSIYLKYKKKIDTIIP